MEYDLHNSVLQKVALTVADGAISSDTDTDGEVIDTLGFESIEFIVQSGTITDGTYVLTVLEDDNVGFASGTEVSSELILGAGTDATFLAADDDSAKRIGTISKERWVKLRVTSTGTTTGGALSAVAVLSNPHTSPTAAA